MKTLLTTITILLLVYIGYRTYRFVMQDKHLKTRITDGAIILDVRTPAEYQSGHIDGSLNISLGTLHERYPELDTGTVYITTCSHGLRSVKAESLLKERGFRNVYNGGAWSDLEKIIRQVKK